MRKDRRIGRGPVSLDVLKRYAVKSPADFATVKRENERKRRSWEHGLFDGEREFLRGVSESLVEAEEKSERRRSPQRSR